MPFGYSLMDNAVSSDDFRAANVPRMNKNIVLRKSIPKTEPRTLERIRAHYEIEKELASRLRNAGREERKYLYAALYDELFQRVPDHSLLTNKNDSNVKSKKYVRQQTRRIFSNDS